MCFNWSVFGVLILSAKTVVRMLCHTENKFPLAEESELNRMKGVTQVLPRICVWLHNCPGRKHKHPNTSNHCLSHFQELFKHQISLSLCVYVLAWLVTKICTHCKEVVFDWMGLLPLCVTMGFQGCASTVLLVNYLFSDLSCSRFSPGMKRSWETLIIYAGAGCVALLALLCMFKPLSCSCTEQLIGKNSEASLPPLHQGKCEWGLHWLSWLYSQLTGFDYPDFLLSPDYLPDSLHTVEPCENQEAIGPI